MRRFVVVGHKANSEGDFNLDDLPGAGRMDIMAMSTSSALFLSHNLREDVEVWLFLMGGTPRLLRIIGREARYLFPDERNMASAIRNALIRYKSGKKMMPGIYIDDIDLESALSMASEDSELFYLIENGRDISEVEFSENSTFILGDHKDLSEDEENILMKFLETLTYRQLVL
jgi:tRNA (pseudouridine54-N1)-methyltransferase